MAICSPCNSYGLADALRRALRSSRRAFDAEALVRTMVFNRLCAPDSKLGCLAWLDTVAMPGISEKPTHDDLLRCMDALAEHAEAVEDRVAELLRPMLDQQLSVVFYDLTTVRIHGEGEVQNDLRRYGMNKETGGIARQFVLGVVQSAEGLPLMHVVHPGNVAETKTLQSMLEKVLKSFDVQRVILVADRGLLSLDNVAEIKRIADVAARRLEFILAVPARRYIELGGTLPGLEFRTAWPKAGSPSIVWWWRMIRCVRRSKARVERSGLLSLKPLRRRWCQSSMPRTRVKPNAVGVPAIAVPTVASIRLCARPNSVAFSRST